MKSEFLKRLLSSIVLLILIYIILKLPSSFFVILLFIMIIITIIELKKIISNKIILYFGYLFVICSYLSVLKIHSNIDKNLFLFLLLISIMTDLGGYIFGKLIGGPKLTKISPNKTYAGFVGSLVLVIIMTYFFMFKLEVDKLNLGIFNTNSIYTTLILSIFLSFISQIGDLIVSFFKRQNKIKDTGNIIPGHGGILDRIDGMLFVFPTYLFLNFILHTL